METPFLAYILVLLLGLGAGVLLIRFLPTKLLDPIKRFLDKQGDGAPHFIFVAAFLLLAFIVFVILEPREELPLGGPVKNTTITQDIDALYEKYGGYLQVTKDGRILYKDQEVSEVKLRSKLPPGTHINVYSGPNGDGFQVVTEYEDRIEYVGYGVNATDYTYTHMKPVITASST